MAATIGSTTGPAAAAPTAAPAPTPGAPRLPVGVLTAVGVGLAGLISWFELDRLVADSVSREGVSRSLTALTGPTALFRTDYWKTWAGTTTADPASIARWITVAVLADAVFFICYFWLLRRWTRPKSVARRAVWVLLGAEIAEGLLLLVAAACLGASARSPLAVAAFVTAVASTAKWAAVVVLVVALARSSAVRSWLHRRAVRAFRALRVQRLSLVILVVLIALSLLPLPNLFDQFPDVVRSWFEIHYDGAPRHFWAAIGAYLIATVALFVLGRQRSERSWTTWAEPINGSREVASQHPGRLWWLIGPVVAVAVGIVLTPSNNVDWRVVGVFVGVPGLLLFISWVVGCAKGGSLWQEVLSADPDVLHARRVWRTGDLLATGVLLVAALSVVRALVAPVVLDIADPDVRWGMRLTVLVIAVGVLGMWPHAADRIAAGAQNWPTWLAGPLRPYEKSDHSPLHWTRPVPLSAFVLATAWLVVLVLFPVGTTGLIGVAATAISAITAWTLVLGLLIVHLQYQRPLEVFRLLRLRATPVLSLFFIVPLVAALAWHGVHDLHAIRTSSASAQLDRQSISDWFKDWQKQTSECAAVLNGREFRPLVLVAASGGGIRAAYWTQGIMTALASNTRGPCDSAVFLSSGVSGGSVGLVVARSPDADGALNRLSRPDGLSAALAGLFVGDLVAGSTGLRVPSEFDGDWAWRDRAGLMETVWERDAGRLGDPFDPDPRAPVGMLVLNSTSTATGCRVLVSQLELDDGTGTASRNGECSRESDDLPAALDLFSLYADCPPSMTWATAAMLSSRFPFVTPSGRVPPDEDACPSDVPDLQLIDGGYAESSGLATLEDVAPAVMREVVAYNATAATPVVPLVLYLEDEPRTGLARDPGVLTPETVVPYVGSQTAGALQAGTTTWLQRAAVLYGQPCPGSADAPTPCQTAVDSVHELLSDGVVVAAPATEPSVNAPLGWTLSSDSRDRLDDAIDEQVDGRCTDSPRPAGYTCLAPLLDLLR